jgi:hypothetical protein
MGDGSPSRHAGALPGADNEPIGDFPPPSSRIRKELRHEGRYRHRQRRPHAGRGLQWGFRSAAGARAGESRRPGVTQARRRRARAGLRGHSGADPDRGSGAKSRPAGFDRRRHSGREPGLGREPALRLGPACGRARLPGHPQRRFRNRGGRRPGVHESGAALRPSPRRREDGQLRDGRHHDQGRPVGCLQRLPHGQHRRERGPAVADHARR